MMQRLTPTLTTDDLERTIAFYREALEFVLVSAAPEQPPYSWALLRCGAVELMLQSRASLLEERDWAFLGDLPIGGTFVLYIEMEDLDAFYERVKDRLELVFPLDNHPYGMREFTARDCNGYILAFGQRI